MFLPAIRIASIIVPVIVVSFCDMEVSGHDPSSLIRGDSAGLELVENSPDDWPLDWRFRMLFRLGGVDVGPESFYRLEPRGVQVDGRKRLYVLDRASYRVLAFDSTGGMIHAIGGQGGGPGKLLAPRSLAVTDSGEIWVLDYSQRGFARFDTTGEFIGNFPLELPYTGEKTEATATGILLSVASGAREASDSIREAIVAIKPGGEIQEIVSFSHKAPNYVQYTGCVSIPLRPLFSPRLNWSAHDSTVVVSAQAEYVVDVFKGQRRVRSIRRKLPLRPVSRGLALATLGNGKTVQTPYGKCRLRPDEELAGRGYASVVPMISDVSVSPSGMLWVQRYALHNEPALIDVFDSTGAYLGTLPTGAPFAVEFLDNWTIVAIERDDFDIDYLVVYRVDH